MNNIKYYLQDKIVHFKKEKKGRAQAAVADLLTTLHADYEGWLYCPHTNWHIYGIWPRAIVYCAIQDDNDWAFSSWPSLPWAWADRAGFAFE